MRGSSLVVIACLLPSIATGQVFGPKTYEDCVLRGLKDVSTESAVSLLQDACEKKFPENKGSGLLSDCNLTWNGDRFLPGAPKDRSRYTAVRFSTTANMVFFPTQMDPKLMRTTLLSRRSEVVRICPGIKFD